MINWNIIRAAGIGAYLVLWMSVVWGLVSTTSMFGARIPKSTANTLHQSLSTVGVLLLATHLGSLLVDSFMPFTPLDLVIPMRTTYKPVGIAIGISAMFVMLIGVLATSWGRRWLGTKMWRALHVLSVPAFALALVHGLMTGTDTRRPAMWWMYVITACVVVFFLIMRALTAGERPKRATVSEGIPLKTPVRARADAVTASAASEPAAPGPAPSPGTPDPAEEFHPPRRRSSPLAKRPAPTEIVKESPPAALPLPLLRVHEDFGVLAGPDIYAEETPSLDEDWPVLAEDLDVAAAASGATARPGGRRGVGHAPDPVTEGDLRRGHAPKPRPANHSPDGP